MLERLASFRDRWLRQALDGRAGLVWRHWGGGLRGRLREVVWGGGTGKTTGLDELDSLFISSTWIGPE